MNSETYKKKVVDFSDEKNIMAMDITVGLRGLYVNDTRHGNVKYTDDNIMIQTNSENESECSKQDNDLRKKVIEKMSKRYYAKF